MEFFAQILMYLLDILALYLFERSVTCYRDTHFSSILLIVNISHTNQIFHVTKT